MSTVGVVLSRSEQNVDTRKLKRQGKRELAESETSAKIIAKERQENITRETYDEICDAFKTNIEFTYFNYMVLLVTKMHFSGLGKYSNHGPSLHMLSNHCWMSPKLLALAKLLAYHSSVPDEHLLNFCTSRSRANPYMYMHSGSLCVTPSLLKSM